MVLILTIGALGFFSVPAYGAVVIINENAGQSNSCVEFSTCYNPHNVSFGTWESSSNEIIWENHDSVTHTITSGLRNENNAGVLFDSGSILPGKDWSYQFTGPLKTDFHCKIHPWMEGQINIRQQVLSSETPMIDMSGQILLLTNQIAFEKEVVQWPDEMAHVLMTFTGTPSNYDPVNNIVTVNLDNENTGMSWSIVLTKSETETYPVGDTSLLLYDTILEPVSNYGMPGDSLVLNTEISFDEIAQVLPVTDTILVVSRGSETFDSDGDGILDGNDNCISVPNTSQVDTDNDGVGDMCDDSDADGDGILDRDDNCIETINRRQLDTDNDGVGNACNGNIDSDGDEINDDLDNCPSVPNTGQWDRIDGGDGIGDACDDSDSDGVYDSIDNCWNVSNSNQNNDDSDRFGDACDLCRGFGSIKNDSCNIDVFYDDIQVIQSIQDEGQPITILSGKPTWVRILADSDTSPLDALAKLQIKWNDGSITRKYAGANIKQNNDFEDANTFDFFFGVNTIQYVDQVRATINQPRVFGELDYTNNDSGWIDIPVTFKTNQINMIYIPIATYVGYTRACNYPSVQDVNSIHNDLEIIWPATEMKLWLSGSAGLYETSGAPWGSDELGAAILNDLKDVSTLSNGIGPNKKYAGLICDEDGVPSSTPIPFGGVAYVNSDVSASKYVNGVPTLAHELGHNFGLEHVRGCGVSDDTLGGSDQIDSTFPYTQNTNNGLDQGSMGKGIMGFDGSKIYDSSDYDIMTYCSPEWFSKYNYIKLLSKLSPQLDPISVSWIPGVDMIQEAIAQSFNENRLIYVTGIFDIRDNTLVETKFRELSYDESRIENTEGSFVVQFRDSQNNILHKQNFSLETHAHTKQDVFPFAFISKYPADTKKIILKDFEKILLEKNVSQNVPEINLLFPNGGEFIDEITTISWESRDLDNDVLFYDILYSTDGGLTWNAIATDLKNTEYDWETSFTPGSNSGKIRILASDGTNTSIDESDSVFQLVKKSPKVFIDKVDSEIFEHNSDVKIMGTAYDAEDGLLRGTNLVWTSNKDGIIEKGETLNIQDLSPGKHVITLTAIDSEGNEGKDSISIRITEKISPNLQFSKKIYSLSDTITIKLLSNDVIEHDPHDKESILIYLTIDDQTSTVSLNESRPDSGEFFLNLSNAENYVVSIPTQLSIDWNYYQDGEIITISDTAIITDKTPDGQALEVSSQPNLVVSSMTHLPANPDTDDLIGFTAVVENIGDAQAPSTTLEFRIGGETPGPSNRFNTPILNPGDTWTKNRSINLNVAQNYMNTAIIDVFNTVAESDESNNKKTLSYQVTQGPTKVSPKQIIVPSWIKPNAEWWSQGQISDESFVNGLRYMIKEGIMRIPETQAGIGTAQQIPDWIKQNAEWWSAGQISDESFVNGIQWLIENGIMRIR